jgi:hypothetical protein
MNWTVDKYEAFAIHVWPTVRRPAIACLAVFAVIFVASGGTKGVIGNAHRLSCHVNELAFGAASEWSTVNCEAWFRIHY